MALSPFAEAKGPRLLRRNRATQKKLKHCFKMNEEEIALLI